MVTSSVAAPGLQSSTIQASQATEQVALADVNNDGKLDVVVANYRDNAVSVFLGNGDGSLKTRTTFADPNVAGITLAVAALSYRTRIHPLWLLAVGALAYTLTAPRRYRVQRSASSAMNALLHDNLAAQLAQGEATFDFLVQRRADAEVLGFLQVDAREGKGGDAGEIAEGEHGGQRHHAPGQHFAQRRVRLVDTRLFAGGFAGDQVSALWFANGFFRAVGPAACGLALVLAGAASPAQAADTTSTFTPGCAAS